MFAYRKVRLSTSWAVNQFKDEKSWQLLRQNQHRQDAEVSSRSSIRTCTRVRRTGVLGTIVLCTLGRVPATTVAVRAPGNHIRYWADSLKGWGGAALVDRRRINHPHLKKKTGLSTCMCGII